MFSLKYKKCIYLSLILFFIISLFLLWNVYNLAFTPLIPKNEPPKVIRLEPAETAAQFVRSLKKEHLIQNQKALILILRATGLSQKLKAGIYQVLPGETALELLYRVASGDVLIQSFTIIAGTTVHKISQDLEKANYLEYQANDWDLIKEQYPSTEGLLLADTYQYQGGSSSKKLLQQAHRNLMTYLNTVWAGRDPKVPYKNPYELLIAASIIEKESALPEERQLISGVVLNRLNKKMPLQMDPTVIYGLGTSYTGKLSHQNMHIDSPYNSYLYRGLPPTPIAVVSKQALDAAAHPQISLYLYFVAKGDGSHQFSETYEQQKHAIIQYQRKGS